MFSRPGGYSITLLHSSYYRCEGWPDMHYQDLGGHFERGFPLGNVVHLDWTQHSCGEWIEIFCGFQCHCSAHYWIWDPVCEVGQRSPPFLARWPSGGGGVGEGIVPTSSLVTSVRVWGQAAATHTRGVSCASTSGCHSHEGSFTRDHKRLPFVRGELRMWAYGLTHCFRSLVPKRPRPGSGPEPVGEEPLF